MSFGTIHFVGTTRSTNDDLRSMALEGAPDGTAIVADHQTAGRGRLGRTWESPAGANLLMSMLIRRPLRAERVPLLCLATAVGVAQSIGAWARIKWPNDVLAPDLRKVCGILAEAEFDRDMNLAWAILGVGVNLTAAPPLPNATSLEAVDGRRRDRNEFAHSLLERIGGQVDRLERSPSDVLADWRRRNVTLERTVRIGDVAGVAVDIDPDGALRVRGDDGRETRVLTGDVEMVLCNSTRAAP